MQAPAPSQKPPTPRAAERRVVLPKVRPLAATAPTAGDVFKGLGAWVDLYDFALDPTRTVAQMHANGVRTLYLQTGRTDTADMIDPHDWSWLIAAHRAGIKVVGWYLPYYSNMNRDLARTLAIARENYHGQTFDGLALDIEYRGAVGGIRWNRRVAALNQAARRALGSGYPIGAIVPPPLQMAIAPKYWGDFPWEALGASSDAFLLMSYWSDRTGCPVIRRFCAFEFTAWNVLITRKIAARPGIVVHIIGGVASAVTTDQLRDFVRGAFVSRADGASVYDAHTTSAAEWPILRLLAALNNR